MRSKDAKSSSSKRDKRPSPQTKITSFISRKQSKKNDQKEVDKASTRNEEQKETQAAEPVYPNGNDEDQGKPPQTGVAQEQEQEHEQEESHQGDKLPPQKDDYGSDSRIITRDGSDGDEKESDSDELVAQEVDVPMRKNCAEEEKKLVKKLRQTRVLVFNLQEGDSPLLLTRLIGKECPGLLDVSIKPTATSEYGIGVFETWQQAAYAIEVINIKLFPRSGRCYNTEWEVTDIGDVWISRVPGGFSENKLAHAISSQIGEVLEINLKDNEDKKKVKPRYGWVKFRHFADALKAIAVGRIRIDGALIYLEIGRNQREKLEKDPTVLRIIQAPCDGEEIIKEQLKLRELIPKQIWVCNKNQGNRCDYFVIMNSNGEAYSARQMELDIFDSPAPWSAPWTPKAEEHDNRRFRKWVPQAGRRNENLHHQQQGWESGRSWRPQGWNNQEKRWQQDRSYSDREDESSMLRKRLDEAEAVIHNLKESIQHNNNQNHIRKQWQQYDNDNDNDNDDPYGGGIDRPRRY